MTVEFIGTHAPILHLQPQGVAGDELIEGAAQFYVEVIEALASHIRMWDVEPAYVREINASDAL
jgi:hypothetical protein